MALIPLAAIAVLLLVWELWICEGAHFGRRFVVAMYDLAAGRYDGIKRFDSDWERRFVGEPLAGAIAGLRGASILDVGAGTGRAARALLSARRLDGPLVCLEPSRRMMDLGRERAADPHVHWVRGWSIPLPFPDDTFDFGVCLEVLEFTPRPRQTLEEIRRVLRPGGWLLVTNRVGREAPWILGRTVPRRRFQAFLESIGLCDIDVMPWQVDYDLAWARKP